MTTVELDPGAVQIIGTRRKYGLATLLYALAIVYASLILGPNGLHFVPRNLGDAARSFLSIPYGPTSSDQRADWMANLAMFVPFGFLWMGTLWTPKPAVQRWLLTAFAISCSMFFVIAVKYAQLFFPPRSVTLGYILAQTIGSGLGIATFWIVRPSLHAKNWTVPIAGRRALRALLSVYAFGLVLYFLFPFDFVLSTNELNDRLAYLPKLLLAWPGEGRPTGIRFILTVANAAETIPLGVLLAVSKERPTLERVAMIALAMMSVVTIASAFVISATPYLASIILRTIGIVIGAAATMKLGQMDCRSLRPLLALLVPFAVVPYVFSVLFINGLLSSHWRTLAEAWAALDYRGLLPMWHYYIVSKAHAMSSLIVHVVTFAPIGVMVSLRVVDQPSSARQAAVMAFVFAFLIEIGRWLKPGLQPDFNDAVIAAISAWLAVKMMPFVWEMVDSLSSNESAAKIPGSG